MPRADLFDRLSSLADPTRSRLLFVVDRHEMTVGELCSALQLPQSTISRHLKQLGDFGWVTSRAEGTSRLYRMVTELEPDARKLWHVVRDQLAAGNAAKRDAERVEAILARRRAASEAFFSSAVGQWDSLRDELFGGRAHLAALPALLDPAWTVGDLGCGTGQLSALIAPHVARVTAVDSARGMLTAARKRLTSFGNVDVRQGTLESLPIESSSLDVAVLFLVLHYIAEPSRALTEAARVLKPEGRLLVVDMLPHDRSEYRDRMGHVWQGFSESQLNEWVAGAGLGAAKYHPLPVDPQATGPALFVASARVNNNAHTKQAQREASSRKSA
jgi:ubiquinone/menaquinone biosynthesis C-methylase UbiE/DNA-binding transcriptional ArsR family regulator